MRACILHVPNGHQDEIISPTGSPLLPAKDSGSSRSGKAIHQLVTIVTPGTFLRWIREAKVNRKKGPSRKRGRPKSALAIRRR